MNKRIFELDVFRGIAAVAVMLYHYTTHYDRVFHHTPQLHCYFPYGRYGVQLFFIISGFVIFMTLKTCKKPADFVIKRFTRLYPAYWAAIIFTFVIVRVFGLAHLEINGRQALANLTMLQGFFGGHVVDGSYWTLTVELSFYGIMLFVYCIRCLDKIEIVSILWLIGQFIFHIIHRTMGEYIGSDQIEMIFIFGYAHLFILGMMFYRLADRRGPIILNICIIVACIMMQKYLDGLNGALIVTAFSTLFSLLILNKLGFIVNQFTVKLGTISYALYLIHAHVGFVIIRIMYQHDIHPIASILTAVIFILIVASCITFWIEKPFQCFMREMYHKMKCAQSKLIKVHGGLSTQTSIDE